MKRFTAASRVTSSGATIQLDRGVQPEEVVREEDVQSPPMLARLLTRMLAQVAEIRRRFYPRRIDFEDVACPGNPGTVRLPHKFGGRVRWSIVEWSSNGGFWILDASHYYIGPALETNKVTSDADTLVLNSYYLGTATIRVEEVG